MSKLQKPIRLVIIGRPNVGKSTLFNRLFGRRRALVHDEPGVTRDRLEEETNWIFNSKDHPVILVDTGGLGGARFAEEIQHQVNIALDEADVVIMLFDGQVGLTSLDEELIMGLKKRGLHKKVSIIGVVNKIDANVHEDRISEFYTAGLDPLLTVSAEHARGIDELKMAVLEAAGDPVGSSASDRDSDANEDVSSDEESWDEDGDEEDSAGSTDEESDDSDDESDDSDELESDEDEVLDGDLETDSESESGDDAETEKERSVPQIAIVGKPNVGKSTLVNALVGQDRMITSPIAGTTVDSVDSTATLNGKEYLLIDTAGIRRKNKTEQGIEVLSVVQTRKALERADIAILLLDGEEGIAEQDEKIGGIIEDVGCSVILVMNKWDTQKRNQKFTTKMAAEKIRGKMAYLRYAPIMFVSAKEGKGLNDLGDLIEEILHQRKLKLQTHEFTEWVKKEATIHNPMNAKFYMSHQSGRHPPTFVCHVSDPEKVHFSLRRHLVNALRERWGYMGTPVRLLFVKGQNDRPARRVDQRKRNATRKANRARFG